MLTNRKARVAALVGVAGLLLSATACSGGGKPESDSGGSGGSEGAAAPDSGLTIAMVTHEQPGTTFWDRVRAGAEQAAKQHGITLKYSNDPEASKQATLIQNAVDSKVDAVAATLASPDAVGPALADAADAGIPTVALNAGIDSYQDFGALMYFGSDESLAGEAAGARLAEEGGTKALCIVHAEGVISLEDRCAGVKKSYPNTENLQVNGADLAAVTSSVQAKLSEDDAITDIVTLDAGVATAVMQAKDATGSDAKIVTFDLNQDVVTAIQDKKIEFCIDQQPYLQGYEAIDSLWLYLTNGNDLGGGQPVLTGPSFVDADNIDRIAEFAANNTR
jgi:simple sugar transport system substrate-binding protein